MKKLQEWNFRKISLVSGMLVLVLGLLTFVLDEPASGYVNRLLLLAFIVAVVSESYAGKCSISDEGIPFKLAASSILLLMIVYGIATTKIILGEVSVWDIVDILLFVAFIGSIGLGGYWVFKARTGRRARLNLLIGILGMVAAIIALVVIVVKIVIA